MLITRAGRTMKKKLLGLLLSVVTVNIVANNDSGELAVVLAHSAAQIYIASENHKNSQPSQRNFLKRIYWMHKNNPHFYKLNAFKEDLDYYLAVLPEHIKTLEDKILTGKNPLTSKSMLKAIITSGIAAACCYSSFWFHLQKSNPHYACMTFDLHCGCVGMGLISAAFGAVATNYFYKVARYAERLVERLERDRKLLELLSGEKTLQGEFTIDAAAIRLLKVVVEAINVAVDEVVVIADKAKAMNIPNGNRLVPIKSVFI